MARKKKKCQKNRFKPISKNQIIVKLDLDYTDEENEIDFRGKRYYLVTNFKRIKRSRLETELFVITTKEKLPKSQHPIRKLPNCLPNASFIDYYPLIKLRLKETKYHHYLCSECSAPCLDDEEFTEIIKKHKDFRKENFGQPFLEVIKLEIF